MTMMLRQDCSRERDGIRPDIIFPRKNHNRLNVYAVISSKILFGNRSVGEELPHAMPQNTASFPAAAHIRCITILVKIK